MTFSESKDKNLFKDFRFNWLAEILAAHVAGDYSRRSIVFLSGHRKSTFRVGRLIRSLRPSPNCLRAQIEWKRRWERDMKILSIRQKLIKEIHFQTLLFCFKHLEKSYWSKLFSRWSSSRNMGSICKGKRKNSPDSASGSSRRSWRSAGQTFLAQKTLRGSLEAKSARIIALVNLEKTYIFLLMFYCLWSGFSYIIFKGSWAFSL